MKIQKLSFLDPQKIAGKKALVRVDFNVPLENGIIQDDSRIRAALPTIQFLLDNGAGVVLMSHLGRPKGSVVEEFRLDHIAVRLSELLGKEVKKVSDCIGEEVLKAKRNLVPGSVLLLENTRFHLAETENIMPFAKELASECDFFVQDAFGCVHRAHASTEGVAHFLPSLMGFLLEKEITMLSKIFEEKKAPLTLVIGGAKIDTKIGVIRNFLKIADNILIGGGLANTFLFAKGEEIRGSLCEKDKAKLALQILQEAGEEKCRIVLPKDFLVATEVSEHASVRNVVAEDGGAHEDEKILDIGEASRAHFGEILKESQMIVWNGPVGLFEFAPFEKGTKAIAEQMAETSAITIVGGGDSVDAIHRFGIPEERFSHVSTGGGAMLEFLEGKALPGISVLRDRPEF